MMLCQKYLMLVLVLFLSCNAYALTEPSNTSPDEPSNKVEAGQTDARLTQKIAYEARNKSVKAILSDLTDLTGIKFYAGYNNLDWQVRDRKMNIFAKDIPLSSLMNSIARVMKFKWSKNSKSDPPTYRLFMDRKTLLDAESQKARQQEWTNQWQTKKREKWLSDRSDMGNMSDQELQKLKDQNPYLYLSNKVGLTDALDAFFRAAPAAKSALLEGQELSLNGSELSPEAQQALVQMMQSAHKITSARAGNELWFPSDVEENAGQVQIRVNTFIERVKAEGSQNMYIGDISLRYGDYEVPVPLANPDKEISKCWGKAMIRCLEEGKSIDDVRSEMKSDFDQAAVVDGKDDPQGEPLVEHPDDPELRKKVKMEPKGAEINDIQAALAEAAGLSIVSDSFGKNWGRASIAGEVEIRSILERMASVYHYNWEKYGSSIEFRDRDWFAKRAAQIPDEWLDRWRDEAKKTSTIDINSLAEISQLTFEQMKVNILGDEILKPVSSTIYTNKDLLRVYATLTEKERHDIYSQSGMVLSTPEIEVWPEMKSLILGRNGQFLSNEDTRIIFKASRSKQGKLFEYTFTATTDSGDMPAVKWQFVTPEYREPQKSSSAVGQ